MTDCDWISHFPPNLLSLRRVKVVHGGVCGRFDPDKVLPVCFHGLPLNGAMPLSVIGLFLSLTGDDGHMQQQQSSI